MTLRGYSSDKNKGASRAHTHGPLLYACLVHPGRTLSAKHFVQAPDGLVSINIVFIHSAVLPEN